MDIERRSFLVEGLQVERRDSGAVIRGHAAVFNQLSEDLGGFREQVAPGAFRDALAEDDVVALFNHDKNLVLGRKSARTLRLTEDAHGLAIEIDPPDTQAARDLVTSMERGDVRHMSFGFAVRGRDGQTWDRASTGTVRTLKNVRLFDVSPVVFPAYPQTDVGLRELRAWEAGLRPPTPHNLLKARAQLASL